MKIILYFIVVAIALIFQYYSRGDTLFTTPDSIHYLSGSASFSTSFTFIDADGHHFLFWPPLFSIIIALFQSSLSAMSWVNMLFTGLIAIYIFHILKIVLHNPYFRFLAFIYIILGVHLLLISVYLWSELIFLFFAMALTYHLLKINSSKHHLYLAIMMGFFLCLQRNAGAFIIIGAFVWLWINHKKNNPFIFLAIWLSGSFFWNVYVWFFIPREHFNFDVTLFQYAIDNSTAISSSLIHTFLPVVFLTNVTWIILFILFTKFMALDLKSDRKLQLIYIVPVVYLVFLYLVVIINIAGFPVDIGEGDRFISVITPFLAILFFRFLEKFYGKNRSKWLLYIAVLFLVYPLARTVKNAVDWHKKSITLDNNKEITDSN